MSRVRSVFASIVFLTLVFAAIPAMAAAQYTVRLSGVVVCTSSRDVVTGVRVSSGDRPVGVVDWSVASIWRYPVKQNASHYSVSLTVSRRDPKVRLVVECAVATDTIRVPREYWSGPFRIRDGFFENERCDSTAARGTTACKSAPRGKATDHQMGVKGYCTWGVYGKWHDYTGYWASIGGHAKDMDNIAEHEDKGFYVSSVPQPMSIVVFEGGSWGALGHVGWVLDVRKKGGTVEFDYWDMNGGGGLWSTATHTRKWDLATQDFIIAPRRSAG